MCSCASEHLLLGLQRTSSSSQPQVAGRDINLVTTGNLKTVVTQGAKMTVQAKFGPIPVMTQTFDICEISAQHGTHCPLQPGTQSFYLTVNIPSIAPAVSVFFLLLLCITYSGFMLMQLAFANALFVVTIPTTAHVHVQELGGQRGWRRVVVLVGWLGHCACLD